MAKRSLAIESKKELIKSLINPLTVLEIARSAVITINYLLGVKKGEP